MTSRTQVHQAINGERDYQDGISSLRLTIGEELLLLEEYIARARKRWTGEFVQPEIQTLGVIRKVAGIAVRCMEHHGAPERNK